MNHDKLVLLVTQRVVAEKRRLSANDTLHPPLDSPALESLAEFIDESLEGLELEFDGFITQRSRIAALRNTLR